MLDLPLLSIIVPVYNVGKYLPRCIDSILQMTYKNWQLILVDDGSTDDSGKICDDYTKRDARIEAYHVKNSGVSNARNVGMSHSKGDYIGFVDSDDWVHAEMYSQMIHFAEVNDCDMVQVGYAEARDEGDALNIYCDVEGMIKNVNSILVEYAKGNITNNIWNKIFKRELVSEIKFDVNYAVGEDAKFVYECCKISNGIFITNFIGYFYYCRSDSVMREKFQPRRMEYLRLLDEQIQENWNNRDLKNILISRINLDGINMASRLAMTNEWNKCLPTLQSYIKKYIVAAMLSDKVSIRSKCITLCVIFVPGLYRKIKSR